MPRFCQTLSFLQSPSFRQAQSALIGHLAHCIVIGRTPQARVGNVTPLSIIASLSFQNKCKELIMSLVLPSVQAREGNSHVTDRMKLVCVCTQALIKTPLCLSLSLTHSHTQTHTMRITPHLNSQ